MSFLLENERYYTLKEIAKLTGFPYFSLMRYCREKKLKFSKPGKNYIVKGEWFINFIEKNTNSSK